MSTTVFVCGMKKNGNFMVSFGDYAWSHKCPVFEIDLSSNEETAYKTMVINEYNPKNDSGEEIQWFIDGDFFHEECSEDMMNDLLYAEVFFVLSSDFRTTDTFEKSLNKLIKTLEWMYAIRCNNRVVQRVERRTSRHVVSTDM